MLTSLCCGCFDFYPRSPCGERRWVDFSFLLLYHISIHALLAESDANSRAERQGQRISIHALLAESDRCQALDISAKRISIHALLAESDLDYKGICVQNLEFLSTLSLRRATILSYSEVIAEINFYPRSPCGERQRT